MAQSEFVKNVNGLTRQFWSDAAPTAGDYAVGDICWNNEPAATEFIGFVCVAAGTPGTWKGFGAIEA
jgi:hypothetical protein